MADAIFPNGSPPRLRREGGRELLKFRGPYELTLGLVWTALAVGTSRLAGDLSPVVVGLLTFGGGVAIWLLAAFFLRRNPQVSIAEARRQFDQMQVRATQADEVLAGHALRVLWRLIFANGPSTSWEKFRTEIRLTLFQAHHFTSQDARHFALVATCRYNGGQDKSTSVCDPTVREVGPWFLEREGLPGSVAMTREVATAMLTDVEMSQLRGMDDAGVRDWFAKRFNIKTAESLDSLLIEGLRTIQAYVAIPIEIENTLIGVVSLDSKNRDALAYFFRGKDSIQKKKREGARHLANAVFEKLPMGDLA